MVKFLNNEGQHLYSSGDDRKWQSVTGIIHSLCEPFPKEEKALSSSKNRKSKWYGIPVDEILQAWSNENKRSTELGHWYHERMEHQLLQEEVSSSSYQIIAPRMLLGNKIAGEQRLKNNAIYAEHLLYLESALIAGQVDKIETINYELSISDHKTNKKIDKESYVDWEGVSKKMLYPVEHLDDCNLNHYTLQLSLYAFIILKYSPLLKLKELALNHVEFEIEGEDKYGYPVYRRDVKGAFIVKSVTVYKVPYMLMECKRIVEWVTKNNKANNK